MNIPSGDITFLFTDIEGSTKLAQDFPETLEAALEIHHSILQNAVDANNGFVFEIVGDAFCCAFENAYDAVKAAVDTQIKLANEKWNDAVIKVRIGIHSGNAEWNEKNYMGYITLARSARVMSSAYGEQIIISNDTYETLSKKFQNEKNNINLKASKTNSDLAKDLISLNLRNLEVISFRDLGERRLKDVIQPIRLFQIVYPGLRADFPPLKTLDARPNNLPVQLSSFVGRQEVMKEVKNYLGQSRLLTIIGSGGGGKTRLALQAGADMIDDFSNGVFIAEFASVSDPAFLIKNLLDSMEVNEEAGKSLENTMYDYLKDKEILLIMDNCEHLINECANLAEMLL
ncbi:MAG: adenylate/guanylate cyclase domain-containing protein, partial [Ignavibacteria bacterium]